MGRWEKILGRFAKGLLKSAARTSSVPRIVERPAVGLFAGTAARFAFRLFKDNIVQMPWIADRSTIDAAVDGARADLLRSWNVYRSSVSSRHYQHAESDWQQVLTLFRRNVADLNRRIAAYNLKAPSPKFRRPPIDAEAEIQRIQRAR